MIVPPSVARKMMRLFKRVSVSKYEGVKAKHARDDTKVKVGDAVQFPGGHYLILEWVSGDGKHKDALVVVVGNDIHVFFEGTPPFSNFTATPIPVRITDGKEEQIFTVHTSEALYKLLTAAFSSHCENWEEIMERILTAEDVFGTTEAGRDLRGGFLSTFFDIQAEMLMSQAVSSKFSNTRMFESLYMLLKSIVDKIGGAHVEQYKLHSRELFAPAQWGSPTELRDSVSKNGTVKKGALTLWGEILADTTVDNKVDALVAKLSETGTNKLGNLINKIWEEMKTTDLASFAVEHGHIFINGGYPIITDEGCLKFFDRSAAPEGVKKDLYLKDQALYFSLTTLPAGTDMTAYAKAKLAYEARQEKPADEPTDKRAKTDGA